MNVADVLFVVTNDSFPDFLAMFAASPDASSGCSLTTLAIMSGSSILTGSLGSAFFPTSPTLGPNVLMSIHVPSANIRSQKPSVLLHRSTNNSPLSMDQLDAAASIEYGNCLSKTTRPSNVTLSESAFTIHCTLGEEEEEEEEEEEDADEEDVIVFVSVTSEIVCVHV